MNIIQMSLDASILLISVMLIRLLFINKIPKLTLLILWGIVALKLIIPYSVYSRLDLRPMLQNSFSTITNTAGSGTIQDATQVSQTSNTLYNQFLLTIKSDLVLSLWFIGVITISLFFIITYIRSYKEFQTAIPIKNISYLNEWLRDHKLKRNIQISVSDRITTPLTYKLFTPVIIFPKSTDWNDKKSIQFILAHEYVHIKRLDVLWKVILIVILVLHWFNPLVWMMFYIVNKDLELSCDEKVIRQFGDEAKSEYALSLIKMAERRQKITPYYSNFSKNGIEERIVSIMKLKKTSILGVVFASTLVVGGITLFATTGLATETKKEEVSQGKESDKQIVEEINGEEVSQGKEPNEQFVVEINGEVIQGKKTNEQFVVERNGEEVVNFPILVKTNEGAFEITKEGEVIIKDKEQ